MYRELLLCLLVSSLSIAAPDAAHHGSMHSRPVPEHQTHLLAKRQQNVCPGLYFLAEPPTSLQCNPDPLGTLTLNCTFLSGVLRPGLTQVPLDIAWFFSSDGRVGRLVQVSRFVARVDLSSFESVLVVRNALPGAYFCSVDIINTGLILDSNPLRVDNRTLQDLCLAQELLTLQPPQPRCAQRGIPLDPAVPLIPQSTRATTATINLQLGVVLPTPTFSYFVQPTMNIPPTLNFIAITPTITVTPTVTPTITPAPQGQVGNDGIIGLVVGIVVGVILAVLVIFLIAGIIFFIKKKERNQLPKKKGFRFNQSQLNPRFQEPLLAPPPDKPPPVIPSTVDPPVENIEMVEYAEPDMQPQPYEISRTIRYTGGPVREARKVTVKSQSAPNEEVIEESKPQTPSDTYYSKPVFFKSEGRTFSTSTHTYGELATRNDSNTSQSGMYISAEQLEPYRPSPIYGDTIKEEELLLDEAEASYISNEFSPSGSESEGSTEYSDEGEEGSLATEYSEEDSQSTEYSGEEEEEGEEQVSAEYYHNPTTWTDSADKSPATGQGKMSTDRTKQPDDYVNTTHTLLQEAEDTTDEVKYVNTRLPSSVRKTIKGSTRSAPSVSAKKKRKRITRNKSTPLRSHDGEYTALVHETLNYTSVYSSTTPGIPPRIHSHRYAETTGHAVQASRVND